MPEDPTARSPKPRSSHLDLVTAGAFLLLVALPWEHWLGAKPNLSRMNELPSWAHPLGFDNLGRDLLGRIAAAMRGAVLPLWGAVLGGASLGTWLAYLATQFPQKLCIGGLDAAMALLCSLPVGVVAFAWAAWREAAGLGPVMASLAPLALALAYFHLRNLVRRDQALAYWQAHQALGGTLEGRIRRYGIASAWQEPILMLVSLLLRAAVAIEAALSYLGFGMVEPEASLGNILAAHFELYLRGDWRVLAVVAGALGLAAVFPGAGLRLGALAVRSPLWGAPWRRRLLFEPLSNCSDDGDKTGSLSVSDPS